MIAAIVPIHNEEGLLADCLRSLKGAAADPELAGEEVILFAVLDDCSDNSAAIAAAFGARLLISEARNVGRARSLGAQAALEAGATWLAFTDADTTVPADWFSRQLGHAADVVCGIVRVEDWRDHPASVRARLQAAYVARDGHRHIHGANLGVSADVYREMGGFLPLVVDEDVTLVRTLEEKGARVAWVATPCVVTSARSVGRLTGGFADHLRSLAADLLETSQQFRDLRGSAPSLP